MPETSLTRSLTADQNVEFQILSCMLHSKSACADVFGFLDASDFTYPSHKLLFKALESLFNSNQSIDLHTISDRLIQQNTLSQVGGEKYLVELFTSFVSDSALDEYIEIVANRTTMRNLATAVDNIQKDLKSGKNVSEIVTDAEQEILRVAKIRSGNNFKAVKHEVSGVIEKLEQLSQSKNTVTGVTSGFPKLDEFTSGFQPGDLIILAARPSMGKTALAINFILNAAKSNPEKSVAFASLEMPTAQIVQRMISSLSLTNTSSIKSGQKITGSDWRKITSGASELKETNIYIDDSPNLKLVSLLSKLRRLGRDEDLSMIVIDYLQLLTDGTTSYHENRQQEVSNISRQLKGIARELNVPVICLSQLSRLVERREDKRPLMSDLRESGAIEQDADIVMFLYREGYYENKEIDKANISEEIELILAKHRNGPTGTLKLKFAQQYGHFFDLILPTTKSK